MPEAAATTTTTTLSACCDIAEQILLHGFQQLQASPTPWSALDQAVDILARVTAVRKSLIHLSERPSPKQVGRVSDPTPQPPASDTPTDSDNRQTSDAVARASARDNHSDSPSPDSLSPDPDSHDRQSPDPSVSSIHSIHSIRSIPAMPLSRIAGALTRVMADIARHRAELQHLSPEPQNTPSPDVHPSDPANPNRPEWERRSPERHAPAPAEVSPPNSS